MIEHITNVLILIEKHGLGLVLNAIFIIMIIHSMKTNQKNILEHIEKSTKLIELIEEKLLKEQLPDNLVKVFVKSKFREFIKDYQKEIYLYLLKNNIAINYTNIDNELNNLITKQIYSLKSLLQDKTTTNNTNKLCELIRNELGDIHELIMKIFRELGESEDYLNDKETITRTLSTHFDKILDKGLNDIDNIEI